MLCITAYLPFLCIEKGKPQYHFRQQTRKMNPKKRTYTLFIIVNPQKK